MKVLENIKSNYELDPNKILNKFAKKFTFNRKLAFFTAVILGLIVHIIVYTNDIHNPDCLAVGVTAGDSFLWNLRLRKMGT